MLTLLDASTDLVQALIVDAPEPVIVTDDAMQFILQNRAADQMMGEPNSWATGGLLETVHPDDRDTIAAELQQAGIANSAHTMEFRARHISGRWIPVEAQVRFLETRDGRRVIVHVRDVSETMLLRTRLRHAQKLTAVGRLSVELADELGCALSAIRRHSHAMAGPSLCAAPFGVRAILRANAAAVAVVEQLKAFADLTPRTEERVDVHGLLTSLRRSLVEDVWFDLVPEANRSVVKVERELLWRGLSNLLIALRAQFESTPLTIKTANLELSPWETNAAVPGASGHLAIAVGHIPWSVGAANPGAHFEPPATIPLTTAVMLAVVLLRDVTAAAGGFVEVAGDDPASLSRATVYLPIE